MQSNRRRTGEENGWKSVKKNGMDTHYIVAHPSGVIRIDTSIRKEQETEENLSHGHLHHGGHWWQGQSIGEEDIAEEGQQIREVEVQQQEGGNRQ